MNTFWYCIKRYNVIMKRFKEIYHIDAPQRKIQMTEMKKKEQEFGEIISRISKERLYRRAKDFSLRALALQRNGLRIERDKQEKEELDNKNRIEMERKNNSYEKLVTNAMSVDKKWLLEDRSSDFKRLDSRETYTFMKYNIPFNEKTNQAPTLRQHPMSWQLADFDKNIPISAEGAYKVFKYE